MTVIQHLPAIERALVNAGFPALSPWWRDTIERFYASDRRQLVLRVGRRGGKSSSLCRVAVLEALFGEHKVPPGDVGIVGVVSTSRDEAASRLRTVRAILDCLGVPFRERDQTIELVGRPVVFKVFTGSVAGVVGGTWIGAICDEVARWRDADTGANPAKEVLASLRPTLATQPHARLFLSSSPLGFDDAHAAAFDAGDTTFQTTAFAPTWIANPTLSENECHALEPDARIFAREYGAEPQAGALAAFDPEDVRAAFREAPEGRRAEPIVLVDPSSGGADAWTFGICRWIVKPNRIFRTAPRFVGFTEAGEAKYVDEPIQDERGEPIPLNDEERARVQPAIYFERIGGWQNFAGKLTGEQIVREVARAAKAHGARFVLGDQFERLALESLFGLHGLRFISLSWTAPEKQAAAEKLRRWLRERSIVFGVDHAGMRDELITFEERISPAGALTFRGRKHDDYAMLALLAARAEGAGMLPASPHAPRTRRYIPPGFVP